MKWKKTFYRLRNVKKKEEIINSLIEDSIDLFKKAINENC